MDNIIAGRIKEILEGILFRLNSAFGSSSTAATSANQTSEIAVVTEAVRVLKGGTISINQVTTSVTGGIYVALASLVCYELCFSNNTSQDILVELVGQTVPFVVFAGTSMTFNGITNANQLQIKRADSSNTQVTIQYTANS